MAHIFTCDRERKTWQNIKKSQNIMKMIEEQEGHPNIHNVLKTLLDNL